MRNIYTLGDYLRMLRYQMGLFQRDVMQDTGINAVKISQYENNHKIPCKAQFDKLMNYYQCNQFSSPPINIVTQSWLNEKMKKPQMRNK